MIEVPCTQGGEEWQALRCGVLTASECSKLVTPGCKLSASHVDLMHRLLGEWFTGEPDEQFMGNYWTDRGNALEADAFSAFSIITDMEPRKAGFVFRDESRAVGCSPDGLLKAAGLELKCPKAGTHLGYLAGGVTPRTYVPQIQFSIWVTGFERWYFSSYYPGLPPLIVENSPDPKYQAALDEHVPAFLAELAEAKQKLIDMGVQPWRDEA